MYSKKIQLRFTEDDPIETYYLEAGDDEITHHEIDRLARGLQNNTELREKVLGLSKKELDMIKLADGRYYNIRRILTHTFELLTRK